MSFILYNDDCLTRLKQLEENSVDSIVTDPPYGLSFMGKKWDYDVPSEEIWAECLRVLKPGGHLLAFAGTRTQHRMAVRIEDAGFEIRDMIAWVYSSGFPKSHNMDNHRGKLTCNCEGTALPYAHEKDISRESKTKCDLHGMWDTYVSPSKHTSQGRGEILQQGLQEQGAPTERAEESIGKNEGAKQSSMEGWDNLQKAKGKLQGGSLCESAGMGQANGSEGRLHHGASPCDGENVRVSFDKDGGCQPQRSQSIEQSPIESGAVSNECRSQARGGWQVCGGCGKPIVPKGFGTALKPALEPLTDARKPLIGTVAENVLAHGTGALNIDGCRVGADAEVIQRGSLDATFTNSAEGYTRANRSMMTHKPKERSGPANEAGRWPANLIHDGSDEVVGLFPETTQNGYRENPSTKRNQHKNAVYGKFQNEFTVGERGYNDKGSAARFFYCAKASKRDRDEGLEGFEAKTKKVPVIQTVGVGLHGQSEDGKQISLAKNFHPTVKPTDLMRYLCRLVTPPNGVVLDPFMGSGSTGKAAMLEGFQFIGIEREAEYVEIAKARIQHALDNQEKIEPDTQLGLDL